MFPCRHAIHNVRNFVIFTGPKKRIHLAKLLLKFLLVALHKTAKHHKRLDATFLFKLSELENMVDGLLLCFGGNSLHHDMIAIFGPRSSLLTFRQRLGLAAALLGEPQLLVLDEPTSGLDPFGIRDMRTILESLKQAGTTIVINSHILSEVEKICDTVAFIKHGQLLAKDGIRALVGPGETLEDVFVRAMEGENE